MQIEIWPVDKLIPYEKNPRKNDHAVEKVAQAITEFGFRVPVLIRGDGSVIDGHLRLKAAKATGLTEVPVMRADDMTEIQVRAFRISVNKVAELAKWDMALLKEEIAALQTMDFEVELTGFNESEIDDLLNTCSGHGDDDKVPEIRDKFISQPGDIWQLGKHRLICGDSTNSADISALMDGKQAAMVFTDPPYNVDYQGAAGKIKNDKMSDEKFLRFLRAAFDQIFICLENGGGLYVAHADAGNIGIAFRQAFVAAGFKLASCLVWKKSGFVLGRADYHWQHEPILYGWKPGAGHRWYGGRKKTTIQEVANCMDEISKTDENTYQIKFGDNVFTISGIDITLESAPGSVVTIDKPAKSALHPTMKPVALVERFLVNSSRRGDIVLDPFGGSGSTLIACEKRGRVCRTVELDRRFADVIIRRWQEYSGGTAILAATGHSFAQLEEAV